MEVTWVKVSMIVLIGNDEIWTRMNEMKWNEWFEGSELEQPYGNGPMVSEGVPIKMTWFVCCDQILSKWSESMRNEWIEWNEVKWVIWWIWLEWTLWQDPYGQKKVSLWKWLEWKWKWMSLSKWMDSMRNEWIEVKWSEMSEWMEMTWNNPMGISLWSIEGVPIKVTWVNSVGISLWVENECPYQFDLIDLSENVPMFSWMNVPIKVTWVNLMGMVLWSSESVPIKVTWCEWKWKSLSKWLESMRNEWIEVNRGEMSELKDLTLWTLWEWSLWSREMNPMRVTWLISMRKSLSKWMDSMRFEWIEVNRVKWSEMSDLKDLTLWTLWESPYGRKKVSLSKWLDVSENQCPYQNEWNRWEMNELSEMRWNEWIEGNELEQPYGNGPMVRRRCPYENDLMLVIWSNPIKMIRFDEKWMNWSE